MIAQTITNYTMAEQPIFTVRYLTDRAFAHGFRILNPEFKTTYERIEEGEEALRDCLNQLDDETQNLFHNYKVNSALTPKTRAMWKAENGLDR